MSKTDLANAAADIIDLCNHAGEPTMAATLIREGVSLEAARARIDYAGGVRAVVAMACKMTPSLKVDADYADRAITARVSVADVRARLFDSLAEADEALPLDAHKRTGDGSIRARQQSMANMVALVKAAGHEPVGRKR